jgi:tRNA A37 methylthiotransferase MiaB
MYDTVISNTPLKDREDFDQGLFDIEREGELREWLSNTYMDSLKTVAASAARQKEIRNRPKANRSEIINNQKIKKVTEYFNKMKGQSMTFIPGRRSSISIQTVPRTDGSGVDYIAVENGSKKTDILLNNDEEALAWLTS